MFTTGCRPSSGVKIDFPDGGREFGVYHNLARESLGARHRSISTGPRECIPVSLALFDLYRSGEQILWVHIAVLKLQTSDLFRTGL
jgi:hypothetical protein